MCSSRGTSIPRLVHLSAYTVCRGVDCEDLVMFLALEAAGLIDKQISDMPNAFMG